jgi:hypothetical protein
MNLKGIPTPVTNRNKGRINLHYVLIKDPKDGTFVGADVCADLERRAAVWRSMAARGYAIAMGDADPPDIDDYITDYNELTLQLDTP